MPPDADPGDRAAGSEAGVVHQHVHLGLPLRQRLHDLIRTARQAQVSGHDLRRGPVMPHACAATGIVAM